MLVPSRIIFGAAFGDHVQLNLLLLRQFMNVLPIALSMFLLVYMATRFRSMWTSIPLYVLLLTIPGVIKYNIRFLHPDALVLFLVVLTIFFLQRDEYRFKGNFYLAAVTCALAGVIKLWGLFFFLAIVIYLFTGLGKKRLTAKTMLLAGLGFILVMGATILIADPGILVPSATQTLVSGLQKEVNARTTGYSDSAGATIYQKGLNAWLPYFKDYYLRLYFFFFCFACLLACSWLGDQKLLARMLLGWCLVTAVYLVYFVAAKSYWYMMPLMVPLYISPFLLPSLGREQKGTAISVVLARPAAAKLIWGVVILACGIQFAANLVLIANSPVILNYL